MPIDVIPSLAILKVNFDERQDYIDNFVPFVAACLQSDGQQPISVPDLQAALAEAFGLRIPQGALQTILRRAARQGYVQRSERVYLPNAEALAGLNFGRKRDSALRSYEGLITKLIQYTRDRFEIEWSDDEASQSLLRYLEQGSAAVLAAVIGDRTITTPTTGVGHADYVVASFIHHAYEADTEAFDFLETVVKGSMLAGALLLPDLGSVERKFENVDIYFDTPFLLRAIGINGQARENACRETLELLYETNANIRVFEHTVGEVRGILDALANSMRYTGTPGSAYIETEQHVLDTGLTASDIELINAKLENRLRGLRVSVRPKPPHQEELTLDEPRLQEILREEVRYQRKEALEHDLDCLTAIHRLRKGEFPLSIESSRAIFITSNHALARGAGRYMKEEFHINRVFAPLCLLDHVLTTIVWLKRPMDAPELPRKRIIADCYAAMNPPEHLWKKYLIEIERLRERGELGETDYHLLRFSPEARTSLMDATLGDPHVLTEGAVGEILEAARRAARADVVNELDAERQARAKDAEAAEAEVARIRAMTETELAAEREERRKVEEAANARRQQQNDRVRNLAIRFARWVALAAQVLVFITVGLIVFLGLVIPNVFTSWPLPLAVGGVVFIGTLTLSNLFFGATVLSLTRWVEIRVANRVEQTLRRLGGMEPI